MDPYKCVKSTGHSRLLTTWARLWKFISQMLVPSELWEIRLNASTFYAVYNKFGAIYILFYVYIRFLHISIYLIHKSHDAPAPYPTMPHSEQICARVCSEWCVVGYARGAFWDLWNWWHVIKRVLFTKIFNQNTPITFSTNLSNTRKNNMNMQPWKLGLLSVGLILQTTFSNMIC